MALIAVTSASGSPGVTTTTLAWALAWHRPVLLVEADPTGESAIYAGHFRGTVEPSGGLINLALAQRDGTLPDALRAETLLLQPDAPAEASAWFLPGTRAHGQAPSLVGLWEPLAHELRQMDAHGQDVIVDAGRLGLAGSPEALLAEADLTLLMVRSTLPGLAAARSWAHTLRQRFAAVGGLDRLRLLVLDESRRWPALATARSTSTTRTSIRAATPRVRPYSTQQIAKALDVPALVDLPWDPETAEVYSHGATPPRRWETARLQRAYRSSAETVVDQVARHRAALATTTATAAADQTAAQTSEVQR